MAPEVGLGARDILVVDDDPDIVTLVQTTLAGESLRVAAAYTSDEALAALSRDAFDLILLDVKLPDRDGLETLRILRERGVEIPVIVVTSHASMQVAMEAMKEGAHDFLTKPLRPSDLERIVDEALTPPEGAVEPAIGTSAPGSDDGAPQFVGRSPGIVEVYKTMGRVAQTNATVLVTGESGTGKELVARVLHQNSRRAAGPFLAINCAAIPETLLESELFGHERGAFTGAVQRSVGRVERADGGTLFLDEIGDMPLELQAKVLRLLEQREIERVGGRQPIAVDVRIVAATHRDLEMAVESGAFREDLYYRIAVVRVELPPLRERGDDVRRLTDHFVRLLSGPLGRPVDRVEPAVYERLASYDWPGNVRELRNVVERALILGRGPALRARDLPPLRGGHEQRARPASLDALARDRASLAEVEGKYLARVLEETGWNQTRAAEILDVHRNTLRRKMERYGIAEPE